MWGSGQLTKMVNQLCLAGIIQGLAEGMHFAEKAGLDVARVIDVISMGAAQSWQMDNRAGTMAKREFEFGFAVKWMRKDLDMTLAAARKFKARLPLAALVDQFYAEVEALGGRTLGHVQPGSNACGTSTTCREPDVPPRLAQRWSIGTKSLRDTPV